jgi:hypothetical protein
MTRTTVEQLVKKFITFLETGNAPDGLFAPDVFVDFTMPLWRLQTQGAAEAIALRKRGHPAPGKVARMRMDFIPTGFVLEVEERWTDGGQDWYCREMFRADVSNGSIKDLSVYCTGDWDAARQAEHKKAVKLIRP